MSQSVVTETVPFSADLQKACHISLTIFADNYQQSNRKNSEEIYKKMIFINHRELM